MVVGNNSRLEDLGKVLGKQLEENTNVLPQAGGDQIPHYSLPSCCPDLTGSQVSGLYLVLLVSLSLDSTCLCLLSPRKASSCSNSCSGPNFMWENLTWCGCGNRSGPATAGHPDSCPEYQIFKQATTFSFLPSH